MAWFTTRAAWSRAASMRPSTARTVPIAWRPRSTRLTTATGEPHQPPSSCTFPPRRPARPLAVVGLRHYPWKQGQGTTMEYEYERFKLSTNGATELASMLGYVVSLTEVPAVEEKGPWLV